MNKQFAHKHISFGERTVLSALLEALAERDPFEQNRRPWHQEQAPFTEYYVRCDFAHRVQL